MNLRDEAADRAFLAQLKAAGVPISDPEPEPHIPVPDIEVGRYALRTFDLRNNTLRSVIKDHIWTDGTAIAQCINGTRAGHLRPDARIEIVDSSPHEPPAQGCTCGIYGTTTFASLVGQYRQQAELSVAVFAAEGMTVIGDSGLRTAAARIVAFWVIDDSYAKAYSCCAGVTRYAEINAMLAEYGFPEWTSRYGDSTWPPPPVDFVTLRAHNLAASTAAMSVLLEAVVTPGGRAAIQHAMHFLVAPPPPPLQQLRGLTGT